MHCRMYFAIEVQETSNGYKVTSHGHSWVHCKFIEILSFVDAFLALSLDFDGTAWHPYSMSKRGFLL